MGALDFRHGEILGPPDFVEGAAEEGYLEPAGIAAECVSHTDHG